MSNKIYYNKYDEPKKYSHVVNGNLHESEVKGEWLCDSPIVDRVWFVGWGAQWDESGKATEIKIGLEMLFKNGGRYSRMTKNDETQEDLIANAEKYLDEGGTGDIPSVVFK